jgi:predicted O-methyltransferase YrrM
MHQLLRRFVRVQAIAALAVVWLAGALGLGLGTGAGAVPTAGLMALGLLLAGLALQVRHSLELARRIDHLARESRHGFWDTLGAVRGVEQNVKRVSPAFNRELRLTFQQLEALQNLNTAVPASEVLPATRGWAGSPDLLLTLVDLVIAQRPALVLECGSGASTLWLALAMRRFGIDGRVIALDHDPQFGNKTRDLLARHGVADIAEVRDAPLEEFSLDHGTCRWYARQAWEDLADIDLLFVDGPPATTGPKARYPALPLLGKSLSPRATLLLDDLIVDDMQETVRLWLEAHPEFGSEILPLEKKAAILRRGQ